MKDVSNGYFKVFFVNSSDAFAISKGNPAAEKEILAVSPADASITTYVGMHTNCFKIPHSPT